MWSLRVAALSVQLILVAAVLHRVALLQTPVMLDLFKVALAGAGLAILLAIFALYRIWREGGSGGGRATWGILVAACILAWPAALSAWCLQLPLINDVTTDTRQPPVFRALAETRRSATAPLTYPAAFAEPQLAAYPGVEPMLVRRSSTEAFELVREAVRRLRWTVVQEQPPDLRSGMPGTIEAVDRTLVLGFPDDIVIRGNWSIYGDDALHHPASEGESNRAFSPDSPVVAQAFFRSERQTLLKLPQSGDILFTIRIGVEPLTQTRARGDGPALADALDAMTPEERAYKGLAAEAERLISELR